MRLALDESYGRVIRDNDASNVTFLASRHFSVRARDRSYNFIFEYRIHSDGSSCIFLGFEGTDILIKSRISVAGLLDRCLEIQSS